MTLKIFITYVRSSRHCTMFKVFLSTCRCHPMVPRETCAVSPGYVLGCLLHCFLVFNSLRNYQNLSPIDLEARRVALVPFSSPMMARTASRMILFLPVSFQAHMDSFLQHDLSRLPIRLSVLATILYQEGPHLCLFGLLRELSYILHCHCILNRYPAKSLEYALLTIYVQVYGIVSLDCARIRR